MLFTSKIVFFKRLSILISLIIVSLILWNTYVFFQKFKQEERIKMEILAAAQKELATNINLNASADLPLKIIESSTTIPMILVDEDGSINNYQNLDSIKALDNNYLSAQLAIMKKENEPVEISYNGVNKQYIYYRNSDLLNKLSYYPLALILILILFLSVVYLFFSTNKIAEQNKLWTGMAKETAHQIGTPLSSLLGWISILKSEQVSNEYIDEIEKDVQRLNTIANRFSKIGSTPNLIKEDVNIITKNAFDYLKSRSSKQVHFEFNAKTETNFALLNKELFEWVIENLIKNAIDAMQGKGNVNLTIEQVSNKIIIQLSDSGKGIEKKFFKQIFKPGFTTKKRGWGLGLSLSKRIIEDYHKGKIYVKNSTLNQGTTFEIILNTI